MKTLLHRKPNFPSFPLMHLPPSISFPSFFMNFSVKLLFGFLFNVNLFSASFVIGLATTFFVWFLINLYLALFSSDQFLHIL